MAKNPTNFTFNNGGYPADFADAFVNLNLFTDGGLWLWGHNGYGQLGDNTSVKKSSPVQTVAGGTNWKQVACGSGISLTNNHTGAIKTDGTLWLWGYNTYGQLGNNASTGVFSPVQTVSAGTNWKQVACGLYHTAAIKTDGTLWTFGHNNFGQLGDNTVGPGGRKSSPVQTVSGGANWKSVALAYHTAAIKTDGTLWLWGHNLAGQLGDNTVVHKSSPVQTVSGGTNWKQVSCSRWHTAAIKTDGTLWLWGANTFGGLGDNTSTGTSSPVQTVSGGTNWKLVSCGNYYTSAIKTDGTLWLWGRNNDGNLGDNTITDRSSPVQTVSAGTNWKQVASSTITQLTTIAIKTDGTLWTWGNNGQGALGDNTVANKSSPVQTVSGGTNWKQVSAGAGHLAAISSIT